MALFPSAQEEGVVERVVGDPSGRRLPFDFSGAASSFDFFEHLPVTWRWFTRLATSSKAFNEMWTRSRRACLFANSATTFVMRVQLRNVHSVMPSCFASAAVHGR